MPELAPTVAIPVLPLAQVPPPASLKVVFDATQTLSVPVIAPGSGLTVTGVVAVQPVDVKVKVIVAVPEATPVTTPVPETTVALLVLLLAHVPLPLASLNVVVKPWHTVVVPEIEDGPGVTVTVVVTFPEQAE